MAEAPETDELQYSGPFGAIVARGQSVFMFVAIVALCWIIYHENEIRGMEHDQIMNAIEKDRCVSSLSIYLYTRARGEMIDFYSVPQELINCMPEFLIKQRTNPVK